MVQVDCEPLKFWHLALSFIIKFDTLTVGGQWMSNEKIKE